MGFEPEVVLADVVDFADCGLDSAAIEAMVDDPRAGAMVSFVGRVRNHDGAEVVTAIDYSAHPSATDELGRIARGYLNRDGVCKIAVRHAIGHLEVGDPAVVIAVSAAHRGQAFSVCQALIDQIKAELPIWKKQGFADGSQRWSGIDS